MSKCISALNRHLLIRSPLIIRTGLVRLSRELHKLSDNGKPVRS